MSVKFKIGFTVDAETLFGIISKFLPVQDLHVEEIVERPPPPPPQFVPPALSKVAQRVQHAQITKPKLIKEYRRHPSRPMDLQAGINGIITAILADGKPHPATEFKPLLQRRGFSPNSVGSRLKSLEAKGVVHRIGDGTWEIVTPAIAKESA